MKIFVYSLINSITKDGKIEFLTEEELYKHKLTKYEIPKRINQSKTFVLCDVFSGAKNINTITRIK